MKRTAILAMGTLALCASSCTDMEKIHDTARRALDAGDYAKAMEVIVYGTSDKELLESDTTMLLLSEAYGHTVKEKGMPVVATECADLDLSRDAKTLYVTDLKSQSITSYTFPEMQKIREYMMPCVVYGMDIAPNGKTFAAALGNGSIAIIDIAGGETLKTVTGHSAVVRDLVYYNDSTLISTSNDHTVRAWNLNNGENLWTVTPHSLNVKTVALSPDRKRVASGSNDGTVALIELDEEGYPTESVNSLNGGRNYLNSVAFSPDGKLLAGVNGDGTIKVWDAENHIVNWERQVEGSPAHTVFSPDGKHLLVLKSGEFLILNAEKGNLEFATDSPASSPWGGLWLPDGSFIATDEMRVHHIKPLFGQELIDAAERYLKERD